MTKRCIYISLPPFMTAWLVNDAGGELPVRIRKGSVEHMTIEAFISRPKDGREDSVAEFAEDGIPIMIPEFKYKDSSYTHLPIKARQALEHAISNRFNLALWHDLNKFGNIGKKQKHLILAWMEANGIPDDGVNWDSIAKRYQRLRDVYLANKRQKNKRQKR